MSGNRLDDAQMIALSGAIRGSTALRTLSLGGHHSGPTGTKALMTALADCPAIERVDLSTTAPESMVTPEIQDGMAKLGLPRVTHGPGANVFSRGPSLEAP